MKLPLSSVRGRVRAYIEMHAGKLGADVLEVGSRMTTPDAWWMSNRDLAQGQWTGMDMLPGSGVDVVADLHDLPKEWAGRFTGVVCSEVLEHVARPWVALPKLREVMQPGGHVIITTLFAFPEHGFPDDYYRFTQQGLILLMEDAGFVVVETGHAGVIDIELNDHGEPQMHPRRLPMHTFCLGRVPC